MKKTMVLSTLLFLAMGCFAQADQVYYDPNATAICQAMAFDSSKSACLQDIRNKQYDPQVLRVCAGLAFDSDKSTCLDTIENKHFLASVEISNCASQSFDSSKISCLSTASTEPIGDDDDGGSITMSKIDQKLDKALLAIQRGDLIKAQSILLKLKAKVEAAQ